MSDVRSMQTEDDQNRQKWLDLALRIESVSVSWVMIEFVLSALAAIQVGSLAISAFSVDSAVELVSGVVLFVRLWSERRHGRSQATSEAERVASAVVAACLFTMAAFISFKSGQALAVRVTPDTSWLGFVVAFTSSLVTPWLALQKRKLGRLLDSHALLGDAACSITCAYMAWTLLAGLVLQQAFGWWWADPVAAVGILYFVLHEAWESAIAARLGEAHHHH